MDKKTINQIKKDWEIPDTSRVNVFINTDLIQNLRKAKKRSKGNKLSLSEIIETLILYLQIRDVPWERINQKLELLEYLQNN